MAQYKVVKELGEGSPIGAQAVDTVVEIEDSATAEALVASGDVEVVA